MNNDQTIKIDLIDKIIKLYPELKKDRTYIIDNIIGNNKEKNNNEYVLEKFNYANKSYYRDRNGIIRDSTSDVVGVYEIYQGDYKYYFFNEFTELMKSNKYIKFD